MSRHLTPTYSCLLLLWGLLGAIVPAARALEPFEGFEDIPWGASAETIRAQEKRHFTQARPVNPEWAMQDEEIMLSGITLAPPAQVLEYEGFKGEKVLYYMVGDALTGVVHHPSGPRMFRPAKVLSRLKKMYGDASKEAKRMEYPSRYGSFDPEIEYSLTFDWESPKGRVRVTSRVWQPLDIRQIFSVLYSSAEMNRRADQRLTSIERAREEADEQDREDAGTP